MSRSSNSDSCSCPPSTSPQMAGARSAVIQVEAGGREIRVDARLRDQAAVADEHDVREPEALLELCDLGGERHRVGGITREHLDGDRAAVGPAQQPVDNLQ